MPLDDCYLNGVTAVAVGATAAARPTRLLRPMATPHCVCWLALLLMLVTLHLQWHLAPMALVQLALSACNVCAGRSCNLVLVRLARARALQLLDAARLLCARLLPLPLARSKLQVTRSRPPTAHCV